METHRIDKLQETEAYRTDRISSVHPTYELCNKLTPNESVPDTTDEKDIKWKIQLLIAVIILNVNLIHLTFK